MIHPVPTTLEGRGIRLEPMTPAHADALGRAATDGRLWELWFTSVPEPDKMSGYVTDALAGQDAGHMLPWVVRELTSGEIVGSTRYHDIVPTIDRVEIGYTWYAASSQRTNVNTTCKLLLAARVRDARMQGRRPADGQLQFSVAAGDRGAGSEARRRDSALRRAPGRHRPGCRDVQHPGE